jgi:hypothetical protein
MSGSSEPSMKGLASRLVLSVGSDRLAVANKLRDMTGACVANKPT